MTTERVPSRIEDLLAHREWVRHLARRLVADENGADDLEQETWARALSRPPRHGGALRAWLARVVRNVWIDTHRSGSQRALRELAVARPESQVTSDVVADADAHRRVVQTASELDEPYRTTLLLRYFEGLSVREIAGRTGVPPETVKTRLRRAVERMRARLDAEHRGDRERWRTALAPIAFGAGGVTMKTSKVAAVAALLVTLLAGGVWVSLGRGDAGGGDVASAPSPAVGTTSPAPPRGRAERPGTAAQNPFPGDAALAGEIRLRSDGSVVADATVTLSDRAAGASSSSDPSSRQASLVLRTDSAGRFAFRGIAAGRDYTLRVAIAAGDAPPRRIASLTPAELRDLGTLWLDTTGSVDVTVTAASGSAAGASVEWFAGTSSPFAASSGWTQAEDSDDGGVPVASGVTDSAGRLRFDRVPASRFPVLVVRRAGAATSVTSGIRVRGGAVSRVSVHLGAAAALRGRVVDPARRPVSGLRLVARSVRPGSEIAGVATWADATSASDGSFSFDGLAPGTATVSLRTGGGVVPLGQVRVPAEGAVDFVVAWRAVEGVVTDTRTRTPVPGAVVSAMLLSGEPVPALVSARADADGRYRLESPVAANFAGLEAWAPGLAPAENLPSDRAIRPAAGETVRQDLRLAPASAVGGLVFERGTDGAQHPVAGADVIAYWMAGYTVRRAVTTTGADGRYSAGPLPPGSLVVVQVLGDAVRQTGFDSSGYVSILVGRGEPSPAWSVRTEPGTRAHLDVEMARATAGLRRVSGRVTDRAGAPLADALVSCGDADTVSSPDGTFTLTGVPAEPRTVFARTIAPSLGRASIAGAGDVEGVVVVVDSAQVRGVVRPRDGGRLPPGVVVRTIPADYLSWYEDEDAAWRSATPVRVGDDGVFEAVLFLPAKVRVRAEAPGWVQTEPVTADAAAGPADVVLVLDRAARVEGTVVDDESGTPVAAARIQMDLNGQGRPGRIRLPVLVATTDGAGRFVVGDLLPGEFRGSVEAAGWVRQATQFDAASGAPVVVRLRRAALVASGNVLGPDRRPVAGCSVSASPAAGSGGATDPWCSTGEDGRFELRGAPTGGRWTVMAYPPPGRGFPNRWVKLSGVEEGRAGIEIVLAAASRIAGRVVSSAGRPVRGVVVAARADSGDHATGQATTDDSGAFSIDGLDGPAYDLRADAPYTADPGAGVASCADLVTVVAGVDAGREDLEIRLDAGARIEGTLAGTDGRPLGGTWVVAHAANRDPASSARRPGNDSLSLGARTDAEGRFDIGGLPPGRWRVRLSAESSSGAGREFQPLEGGEDVPAGTRGLRLRVAALGAVEGRVVDETGAPVAGMSVEAVASPAATDATAAAFARTATDGSFRIERLDASRRWAIRAWMHGEYAPSVVEDVAPGATGVVVRAARGLRISGRVVDRDGRPLEGAFEAVPSNGARGVSFDTSADGRFDVGGLAAGEHRIMARAVRGADGRYMRGGADVRAGSADVEVRITE